MSVYQRVGCIASFTSSVFQGHPTKIEELMVNHLIFSDKSPDKLGCPALRKTRMYNDALLPTTSFVFQGHPAKIEKLVVNHLIFFWY